VVAHWGITLIKVDELRSLELATRFGVATTANILNLLGTYFFMSRITTKLTIL